MAASKAICCWRRLRRLRSRRCGWRSRRREAGDGTERRSMIPLVALGIGAAALAGSALFTARTARRVEAALPPRGRFAEVGGQRPHYLDEGSGPSVVMIHGQGGQTAHFPHALVERLKGEFRLLVVDRPGSGYSPRGGRAPANVRAQAASIAALIRHLGLDRPLVVGHSLGGAIALA